MELIFVLAVAAGSYVAHGLVNGWKPCTTCSTEEPKLEIRTKEDELADLSLELVEYMLTNLDNTDVPREEYVRTLNQKRAYINIVKTL